VAARILVVDDDTAMREMMSLALRKEGHNLRVASSAEEARQAIDQSTFDVIVTDIYLGDGTGLEVLEHCRDACPEAKVILVTAHGTVETAASARRLGVYDYLAKPFDIATLVDRVTAALELGSDNGAEIELGPESLIIGNDPAIVEVYNAVARVAPLPVPVLVRGETGTGKELIARALHRFGANPEGAFVALNCGAIPESLLESELFGHRKGSFTGADRDRRGAIEAARDGTLFLDEVGELPPALQVKLLRFLQSGEVRAVGAEDAVQVPVRVVAATHRDLRAEAEAGTFREDFFYRIAAYEIVLPPLRERRSDIPLLVEHFRRRNEKNADRMEIQSASPEVLELLTNHSWPGNVRELEHVVQRTIIDSGGLTDVGSVRGLLASTNGKPESSAKTPTIGDLLSLKELEKLHIEAVLKRCEGNRTRAAEILGIERKSLYRKADRLGIALDPEEVDS
jgi:DNA-binding NtrC family response regulator